jgi:hypothetical protein
LKDNANGTWTFYTKGADRLTGVKTYGRSGATTTEYLGNSIAELFLSPSGKKPDPDAVFLLGDQFWRAFFGNIMDFLNRRGTTADRGSFVTNTKRYPYHL